MIDYQRKIMGDAVRNDALFRALKAVIKPGSTMTDIGSGTGFLSFLALRLGAKHCYLYEASRDLLTLSKRIARENGIHRRCTFIHAHSRDIHSPMKTDVVISETLGNFAFEEHIIETMNDAKRFLKPGGTLISQKLRQYIAPVTNGRLWREINVWDDTRLTLDFAAAKEVALNNMYVKRIRHTNLLHNCPSPQPLSRRERETKEWDSVDFTKRNSSHRQGIASWNLQRTTTIYGFALWWECDVVPGVTLSTSPFAPHTHWEQVFLPLLSPLTTTKGDSLACRLTSDSRHAICLNVTWETTLHRKKRQITRQQQELRKGMIFP